MLHAKTKRYTVQLRIKYQIVEAVMNMDQVKDLSRQMERKIGQKVKDIIGAEGDLLVRN